MAIASNEIKQQQALAMIHDIDNVLTRLNQVKMSLISNDTEFLQFGSTLDPDSPEMKNIERRRQQIAAYEKRIDAEIQNYQNKKKKEELVLDNATKNIDNALQRMRQR